jgi:hypothetical protein
MAGESQLSSSRRFSLLAAFGTRAAAAEHRRHHSNEQLTSFISTTVTIVAALWVMVRRVKQGDITAFGGRKTGR